MITKTRKLESAMKPHLKNYINVYQLHKKIFKLKNLDIMKYHQIRYVIKKMKERGMLEQRKSEGMTTQTVEYKLKG